MLQGSGAPWLTVWDSHLRKAKEEVEHGFLGHHHEANPPVFFQYLLDGSDMRQPLLAVTVPEPSVVHPVRRVLDAAQFFQKNLQVILRDHEIRDMMIYGGIVLAGIFGNGQLSGAVVVGKALRNQKRSRRPPPRWS